MSNHRPASDPGPSLVSIVVMAAASLAAVAYSVWIAWGAVDTRHWLGAAMGFLLAVLMTAQTIGRAIDRDTARARQKRHQARRRPEATPEEAVAVRWPEPIPQTNPAPEEPGEILAAVGRIRVPAPGWRSEADRQAWLDDQDTHIITRPPDWQS